MLASYSENDQDQPPIKNQTRNYLNNFAETQMEPENITDDFRSSQKDENRKHQIFV